MTSEKPIIELAFSKERIVVIVTILIFGILMFATGALYEQGSAGQRAQKYVFENCIMENRPSVEEYQKWVVSYGDEKVRFGNKS